MRTPPQAREAFHLGLAVVAIGQSLITESNGVALAREHREREIDTTIGARDVVSKSIPQKMGAAIKATPGWFGDKALLKNQS